MYTLTCKMCGKEFTSKGANAKYCKPCKRQKKREHNQKKRITSVVWDIEKLSKPATKSMKRLREISKYGVHYYEAKEKWEENERDRESKRKD